MNPFAWWAGWPHVVVQDNPVPTPKPIVVVPTPAPAPTPVVPVPPAPKKNIFHMAPVEYLKTIAAVLGGLATWATANQDMLGQFIPEQYKTYVPPLIVAATGISVFIIKDIEPILEGK